jgi:class 3 adenylate cyclase/tetratricopeptide (TPR) repeat protein
VDVAAWLATLGLARYEQAFRDNDIDVSLLPTLSADDLEKIGVASLGHRKRLLAAVALLSGAGDRGAGPPLPEPPPPVSADVAEQAERRQLTVMFVDLAGSTALASRLDPEEMRELIHAYQQIVAREIARFDGHVAKFMGDGVLAYFGWPQAHEDDAERAVRAALAATAAVGRLVAPTSERLIARAGLATGLVVVVGDLVGSGEAREHAVWGGAPNLAARLQSLAGPGGVVIDVATRRLVQELFEFEALGPTVLKGIAEPADTYRLLGERIGKSRFDAHSKTLRPLIGREAELALLLQRWRHARGGEGQGVLLVGEAGIGKSRLVRALIDAVGDADHVCLRYQGSPLHSDRALWPVGQQLALAASLSPDDNATARLAKLEVLLKQAVDLDEVTRSLIAAGTGLVEGDPVKDEADPRRRRERTLEALLAQILGLTRQRPVLLVVEDAQWLDPTTLELLDQVLGRTARVPVLVLCTSRPENAPQLGAHPQLTRLSLNRLTRDATARIATDVTGARLPEDVISAILDRADGVPLFAEELAQAVLDARKTDGQGAPWQPSNAVPPSLHSSLMARLDRLGAAKEVAHVAACIGREFDHSLLAAIATLPEMVLRGELDRLVAAELVFQRGVPPEATYTFKHALVRDAAHDSLLRSKRRGIHQRIAEILDHEAVQSNSPPSEVLAYHREEAGDHAAAARHWLTTGKRNARRGADAEAIRCFERALRDLEELPDRDAAKRLELDVLLALVPGFMAVGFADRHTAEAAERALALCEEFGAGHRATPLLYSQFSYRFASAELQQALNLALRVVALGESNNDQLAKLVGHRAVGLCWSWMGDLATARRELDTALRAAELVETSHLAFELGQEMRITTLNLLSDVMLRQGDVAGGRDLVAATIDEATRLNHSLTLALVVRIALILHALVGDNEEVRALAPRLRDVCAERDIRQWRHLGDLFELWALRRAGDAVELDHILAVLQQHRESGNRLNMPFYLMLVAEVCFAAGDRARADRKLEEALDLAGETGEVWIRPELLRRRAMDGLVAESVPAEVAEQWLSEALEEARKQGDRLAELRVSRDLAWVWADRGERQQARGLLAPICGWFTGRGELRDLTEARALLTELS